MFVQDGKQKATNYRAFPYIFSMPLFWVMFVLSVALVVLPLYIASRFESIILLPKFRAVKM